MGRLVLESPPSSYPPQPRIKTMSLHRRCSTERMPTAVAVALCFMLAACGSAEEPGLGIAELEHLEEGIETSYDRPPAAAAIEVTTGSETRLWVFACDTNHILKLRIKTPQGWGTWQTAFSLGFSPCTGTPAIGYYGGTLQPSDRIVVYYNSVNEGGGESVAGELIELDFPDVTSPTMVQFRN